MRISALSLLYIIVSFSHTSYSQIKRDISFTIVDTPPRYSGCKGENVAFLKECFRNKVTFLIAQNFDFEQFENVIPQGEHRVFVTFRILEDGTFD